MVEPAERPSAAAEPAVRANPAPFLLEGGRVGILLLHGFSGSPAEVRLLGTYLHERGMTVSAPLLPGHGTTPRDLDDCVWVDWLAAGRHAHEDLRSRCEAVFLGGFSLGAAIAAHLAAEDSGSSGFLAYAPAILPTAWWRAVIPIARLIGRQFPVPVQDVLDPAAKELLWSYPTYSLRAAREFVRLVVATRPILGKVTCPLLVFRSLRDRTVPPASARFLYEGVSSADKELISLRESGHVMLVDREWRTAAARSWDFVRSRTPDHDEQLMR